MSLDIILDVATKVGAPIIKKLLTDTVGGTVGAIGGAVVDAITEKAGVQSPEALDQVHPEVLEGAVLAVEQQLASASLEAQKTGNDLMLAEMQKDSAFGWMWRPAGMWLMLLCILWDVIGTPLLNALFIAAGSAVQIRPLVSFPELVTVFTVYSGLYMGGHTAKQIFKR